LQEVNDLAAKVTNTLEANKAAVTSFNADTAALAESTRTQVSPTAPPSTQSTRKR
jgi:hypothetical protein